MSAISGFSFGLPPTRPLYWPAGLPGVPMAPYWAAVRPLRQALRGGQPAPTR